MIMCHKINNPCTESEADELHCSDAGFYISATDGQIRCYCFKGLDEHNKSKRPCEEEDEKCLQKEK